MAFFVGRLPQTFDGTDFFDTIASRYEKGKMVSPRKQLWRLESPVSWKPAQVTLQGSNIIEGFVNKGCETIGTGAAGWFNPSISPGQYLTGSFTRFRFFPGPDRTPLMAAEKQVNWALETIKETSKPYFLFINFGETHHWFEYPGCPWLDQGDPYGDARECRRRQRACIEYLEQKVRVLLEGLNNYDLVMCADHGEAMGEEGLWGHGFNHPTVMTVPMLIRTWIEKTSHQSDLTGNI
jgi:hypothetical protein